MIVKIKRGKKVFKNEQYKATLKFLFCYIKNNFDNIKEINIIESKARF